MIFYARLQGLVSAKRRSAPFFPSRQQLVQNAFGWGLANGYLFSRSAWQEVGMNHRDQEMFISTKSCQEKSKPPIPELLAQVSSSLSLGQTKPTEFTQLHLCIDLDSMWPFIWSQQNIADLSRSSKYGISK